LHHWREVFFFVRESHTGADETMRAAGGK
jgi:hypothetical protein